MSLPLILQPGEGRSVQIRTSTCTFKVTGKDTHGHFGLFEFVMELIINWLVGAGLSISRWASEIAGKPAPTKCDY